MTLLVEGSGIAPEAVNERGVVSVREPLDLLALGIPVTQWDGPGIGLGVWPPGSTVPALHVYRPYAPSDPKRKYIWPKGVPTRLDSPPRCHAALRDPAAELYITEGIKKADALASHGACAIALAGVYSFGKRGGQILADWEPVRLHGRTVVVVFDSDMWRKAGVLRAAQDLTSFVHRRGASVLWARLPDAADGSKTGADDFLLNHVLAELRALASEPDVDPMVAPPLDDIGNAERFAFYGGDHARWNSDTRAWLTQDGKRWSSENPDDVLRVAKDAIRETQRRIVELPASHPDRDAKLAASTQLGTRARIEAMLALSKPELSIRNLQLDADPMLLNCANGTLDLRTGAIRSHDPEDFITHLAPVPYDPNAMSEDWEQFLGLLTNGDTDMQEHLRRIAGYCLTGSAKEGSIFFLLGPTRTGKSTFLRALMQVMGSYAWRAQADSILTGRRAGSVRDDIAAMEGKRLVAISEVSSGQRIDEAKLKELTGEDVVNARGLYERERNFKPVLKLMFAANDFPHVRSDDSGSWARLNLIRCESTGLQNREHLELKQRVIDVERTGPAILAWAAKGCLAWQEDGHLAVPAAVYEAVNEQRESMKPLKTFVEEVCEVAEENEVPNVELRESYVRWCRAIGESHPIGTRRFGEELKAMGFTQRKSGHRIWVGIGLPKTKFSTMIQ